MKQNKNIKIFVGLLFVSVCIFACQKQNLPRKPEPSAFSAAMKSGVTSYTSAGGVDTIMVTAGEDAWWITAPITDTSWCYTYNAATGQGANKQTYGAGDGKILIKVKPNATKLDRSTQVTLNPTFGLPPVTFTITQSK